MKTNVRTNVLIERIEAAIEKNQRRIADISAQNFELRKAVEGLEELPKGTTLTKADLEARDKANRVGKYYDSAYHEDQRQKAREEAERIKAEQEAAKAALAAALEKPAEEEIR